MLRSLQGLHSFLNLLFTIVVCILDLLRDLFEQLLGEDAQQSPGNVKRRENVAVLIRTLCQEFRLKLVSKLQVLVFILTKGLFTNNSLHGTRVLANGIVGVQLI